MRQSARQTGPGWNIFRSTGGRDSAGTRDSSNLGALPRLVSLWFAPLRRFSPSLSLALQPESKPSEILPETVRIRVRLLRQFPYEPCCPTDAPSR